MIEYLLMKIIILWGLRHQDRFLRLLARLEYGVSIFCEKLAHLAEQEKYYNLASMLLDHAKEEERHGKMLASFVDKQERLTKTESNGRWVSITRIKTGENLGRPNPDPQSFGQTVIWDSCRFPKEKIEGVFDNFDGLSQRYFSLMLFFGGRKAYEFDWCDRLAFMHVLEASTKRFYEILQSSTTSKPLKAIASQISNDEFNHADYLRCHLRHFSDFSSTDIDKWSFRLVLALFGLIVDAWRLLGY